MESGVEEVSIEVYHARGYILVKPVAGMDYWDILTAIGKLLKHDEFVNKNDLWLFREGTVNLALSDLEAIKNIGVNHYPNSAEPKKTAIVVETNFQRALAETYIDTGKEHPREIRIFLDFKEAEEWITSE